MRIPLIPAASFGASLDASISIPGLPLAFIDDEPFLIELQGVLELPGGGRDGERGGMEDVKVGNLDLSEPSKPILLVAHHRLEGKLVTLAEPYALLRSTPSPSSIPFNHDRATDDEDDEDQISASKRRKLSVPLSSGAMDEQHHPSSSPEKPQTILTQEQTQAPLVEIVVLVRRKIVFSKRPEPVVILAVDTEDEDEGEDRIVTEDIA